MCMLPAFSMQMTLHCRAQIDCCGTTMKAYAPRNETFSKTSGLSETTANGNQCFVLEDVTMIYAYMPHLPAHRVTFFATP